VPLHCGQAVPKRGDIRPSGRLLSSGNQQKQVCWPFFPNSHLDVEILDLLVRLDRFEVKGDPGDLVRSVRHEEDCELKLRDLLA
jgi:hypothetical protein